MVTGGAGFIGINLVQKLIEENHSVICIDNLCSANINNIQYLNKMSNFHFIKGDITDKGIFKNLEYVDQIYNLACPASPPDYQADPIHTLKTCFQGMLNVLEFARECNACVLQTSTSEVYGNPLVKEQSEKYFGNVNPNGIRACYDEGKRVAETLCSDFRRIFKLDVKIARIFNTYGPYMRPNDGRIVSNFINAILNGTEIVIYGDGRQTRSLCYVSDTVEGLIALMNSCENGPINIGNPYEMTVNDIAMTIKKIMGSDIDINYTDALEDDPQKRKPNIELAENILHWHPRISLEEGLENTINYYKKIR